MARLARDPPGGVLTMPAPRRPLTPTDPRHGSYAGWQAHRREGSKPCAGCEAARIEYRGEWRATRRLLGMEAS